MYERVTQFPDLGTTIAADLLETPREPTMWTARCHAIVD